MDVSSHRRRPQEVECEPGPPPCYQETPSDRKSTRLNSSHLGISYAVFCLQKKIERLPQKPVKSLNIGVMHNEVYRKTILKRHRCLRERRLALKRAVKAMIAMVRAAITTLK